MQLVDTRTGEIAGDAQEQGLALLDSHFRFLPTGLIVMGKPTLEECCEAAQHIYFIGKMAPIWLGDLLNWMECRWGEGYAQVLDATGFAYQTVVNAKSVMGRVPHEVRQDDLTFTHYSEVASLPSPQQEKLLRQAKDEELNTSEFKRIVRREKRIADLGKIPQMVKLEVNMVFSVPMDQRNRFRFSVEGWRNRLEEWDIECDYLDILEVD